MTSTGGAAGGATPRPRVSRTFTTMIWVGLLLGLLGGVMTLLGLGGSDQFALSVGENTVETTSVGLALASLGLGMAAIVGLNLPEGVVVAVDPRPSLISRILSRRRELLILAGFLLIFFVASLWL